MSMENESSFCRWLLAGKLVFLLFHVAAAQQADSRPHRSVELPRHLTSTPQPMPEQLKLPNVPKTARDVRCFRSFTAKSAMTDVVRKCGVPDEHQGSGIYIFLYDMNDGSVVVIGTADLERLLYVTRAASTGTKSLLRKNQ
jgi:hypothetical protein